MTASNRVMWDLEARVKWLIGAARFWSEDGTFIFPDGETFYTHPPSAELGRKLDCKVIEGRCYCERK